MHFSGRMGDGIHASFLFFFLFSREATSIKKKYSVCKNVRPSDTTYRLVQPPVALVPIIPRSFLNRYRASLFVGGLPGSLYRGIIAVIQLPRTYSRKYSLSRTKLISLSTMRDWNLSTKIISHRCHCWRKLKTLILKSPGQF